ncbi:MAG: (4Fe-4S)-binding protein [Flavobacterium sp.]|nr:MAG: (4Fe-4S)-binding protein [Flavobacterium sp.]
MEIIKEYSNGEVTIVWKAGLCSHSANCAKGLAAVFKPKEKPWINPHGATTQQIVDQVGHCPSGALSIYLNNDKQPTTA